MASASPAPLDEAPDTEATRATERPAASRSPVLPTLSLDFTEDPSTARTILAASLQQPPLKVVRAFSRDDGSALAHLHNVSGGLLGGDELALRVRVSSGAHVQLTTTGATRIYRPGDQRAGSVLTSEINIAENAILEYVPDALIPYAGARFRQYTTIRLSDGAGFFWWEVFAPGREARGEVFEYESLEIATDVFVREKLIAAERARLAPHERPASSLARLGPFRHCATFYICRVMQGATIWLNLEKHLRETAAMLQPRGRVFWGISTLLAHGLVLRCLAEHGSDILPGLHAIWRAAKLALYGTAPISPRKIH